jgi:uncharacterized membrane protein YfhO
MLAIYVMCGIVPFGDATVVTGDLAGLYMPFYADVSNGRVSAFSFSKGLGGGVQGLSAYIPFSPYMPALYLIPERELGVFFSALLFAKIVAAAGTMCFYLCAKTKPSWMNTLLGLCYAFMSYNFIYAQNVMWLDNIVLLPLLLYALDRLIETKRASLFCGLLALSMLANYYTAYMICLFLILYFLWETVGNRRMPLRTVLKNGLYFAGSGLLAVCLSGAVLAPTVFQTLQNKGVGGSGLPLLNFSWREFWRQAIYCGFTWDQLEKGLPIIYCGFLCFAGVALYFSAGEIARRSKIFSGAAVGLFLLSFWIEPLNRAWHAFKPPVWFPYRYSFLFAAFCLVIAAIALDRARPDKKRTWFAAGGVLLCLLLVTATQLGVVGAKKVAVTAVAAAGIALLVFARGRIKEAKLRRIAAISLICAVAIELTVNGYYITSLFELRGNAATTEYLGDISALLDQADTGPFARVEKDDFFALNDPMLLDYNGMNHFSSVADGSSEAILEALGYYGVYRNGTYATAPANALLGVQYIISDSPYAGLHGYQIAAQKGGHTLYRADYTMPFAFYCDGADAAITDNPFDTLNNIYSAIVGEQVSLFARVDYIAAGGSAAPGEQQEIGATYEAAQADGYYYAYFMQKSEGGRLRLDEKDYGALPAFDGRGIVPLGYHADAFSFELNTYGLEVYVLDAAIFESCVKTANQRAPQITEVKDGSIGITAWQAGTIVLSMPYYEDWIVEINGERASLTPRFGHFAAVEVGAGKSDITLRYRARGQAAGFAATACGAVVFVVVVLKDVDLISFPRLKKRRGPGSRRQAGHS